MEGGDGYGGRNCFRNKSIALQQSTRIPMCNVVASHIDVKDIASRYQTIQHIDPRRVPLQIG